MYHWSYKHECGYLCSTFLNKQLIKGWYKNRIRVGWLHNYVYILLPYIVLVKTLQNPRGHCMNTSRSRVGPIKMLRGWVELNVTSRLQYMWGMNFPTFQTNQSHICCWQKLNTVLSVLILEIIVKDVVEVSDTSKSSDKHMSVSPFVWTGNHCSKCLDSF